MGENERVGGLLVLNAGSSSIKYAVFGAKLQRLVTGRVADIGGDSSLRIDTKQVRIPASNHEIALREIIAHLEREGVDIRSLRGVAHRVVHGGETFTSACRIDPAVRAGIADLADLAPLHNPHSLSGIDALARISPELPQYACFDTAFHRTNPDVATRYALPRSAETAGLRRFGFHGISYAGLVDQLPALSQSPCPRRLLAMHLGAGASVCAIHDGKSIATTMGYSPVDGLPMSTRCGSIDAEAVLRLARVAGSERAANTLSRESGLLGLAGSGDLRELIQRDDERAQFAVGYFHYWVTRHAGSLVAALGGCDAIAFTGGIGENSSLTRKAIIAGLSFLDVAISESANDANAAKLHNDDSQVSVWIVPADEERTIARQTLELIKVGTNR